jgi:hypothetical protein
VPRVDDNKPHYTEKYVHDMAFGYRFIAAMTGIAGFSFGIAFGLAMFCH